VQSVRFDDQRRVVVTFSEPIMNVTSATLTVQAARPGGDCSGRPLPGVLSSDAPGTVWTYRPHAPFERGGSYCVSVASRVYDLQGESPSRPFVSTVSPGPGP
jgi:hypothetical protein